MKILLINASPHQNGSTRRALHEVESAFGKDTECEVVWLGRAPILSCTACGACRKSGKCFYEGDIVNSLAEKCRRADAFVFATPVHYAGASGALISTLGRLFYSAGGALSKKPAMALSVARRAGGISTLDEIYKFLLISGMPIISGNYWCGIYGATAEDVERDLEGLQTLRIAARHLEYIAKCMALAKEHGLLPPENEEKIRTSFLG